MEAQGFLVTAGRCATSGQAKGGGRSPDSGGVSSQGGRVRLDPLPPVNNMGVTLLILKNRQPLIVMISRFVSILFLSHFINNFVTHHWRH